MKIAVIGCGSIGRRHIRNLLSLGMTDIVACDSNDSRAAIAQSEFNIRACSSSGILAESPQAMIICTPTSLHLPIAMEAARAGCHLFIEKPLSHDLEGVPDLINQIREKCVVTFVGSNFKFHPSFIRMKEILDSGILGKVLSARCQFGQYLPDWHPWEDYRQTYSARAELGGGILLDTHEFDYMRWFLGEVRELFCLSGKISNLEINSEDTAEIILKFRSGAIGEIHVDYTQRAYQRNYEFFGEEGTLKWDFNDRRVWLYKAGPQLWEMYEESRGYDFNEMYVKEMEHFLTCIRNKSNTISDIHSAMRTLELIMAAKESSRYGQVKILNGADN